MTNDLEALAISIRKKIVKLNYISGSGHLSSSLSALEILIALYFGNILRRDCNNPGWNDRDRFILSKAHASLAYYTVLYEAGYITKEVLSSFFRANSCLGGSLSLEVAGVEWHTGSLGHGLSAGAGLALSARMQRADRLVYVITGDGELDEGSNWEAAMSISHRKLNNVVWIIDKNNIQLSGRNSDIVSLEPLDDKLRSFGFEVKNIDGHNFSELLGALALDRSNLPSKPRAVIANTIKGKGVPLIEDKPDWHGRKPNAEELITIIEDMGMTLEELGAL
jgi:transketolase